MNQSSFEVRIIECTPRRRRVRSRTEFADRRDRKRRRRTALRREVEERRAASEGGARRCWRRIPEGVRRSHREVVRAAAGGASRARSTPLSSSSRVSAARVRTPRALTTHPARSHARPPPRRRAAVWRAARGLHRAVRHVLRAPGHLDAAAQEPAPRIPRGARHTCYHSMMHCVPSRYICTTRFASFPWHATHVLHCIVSQCSALQCIAVHCSAVHCIALHHPLREFPWRSAPPTPLVVAVGVAVAAVVVGVAAVAVVAHRRRAAPL